MCLGFIWAPRGGYPPHGAEPDLLSGARERIVQGRPFHPEGPANRRFTRTRIESAQDRRQFFLANGLGPSAPFPAALGGRQARFDAFLRQGAFVLSQRPEHTEQEGAL